MSEEILINVTPREVRVALIKNAVLQEVQVERSLQQGLVGNIYKGRVSRLLPGIQAAFVDIGLERAAFLHVSDVIGYPELLAKSDNSATIDIGSLLYVGQSVLVQVYKEPLGSKGARLTMQFTIPSRYLVLTPDSYQIAISQKIIDENERQRLTDLITPGLYGGYIFRTVAEGATSERVTADKEFLDNLWGEIKVRIQTAKCGEVIYEEIPIVLRVLRDLAGYNVARIQVDNEAVAETMRQYAQHYVPSLLDKIVAYAELRPIFDIYSVEDEIQSALQRKVSLKSGSYLVFDQTEAMTTIDVNTGSYLGQSHNLDQTIFKTNLEAAEMIARQVRLRNLGGIIIIDFIDMENETHKTHLLEAFTKALARDSVRVEISQLSNLGLVQMTRKRTRESLEHILCVTCPTCHYRGSIKSLMTVTNEIAREVMRTAHLYTWPGFLIVVSDNVINYLMEEESTMLAELEGLLGKPIKLRREVSFTQEQYDILPLSDKG